MLKQLFETYVNVLAKSPVTKWDVTQWQPRKADGIVVPQDVKGTLALRDDSYGFLHLHYLNPHNLSDGTAKPEFDAIYAVWSAPQQQPDNLLLFSTEMLHRSPSLKKHAFGEMTLTQSADTLSGTFSGVVSFEKPIGQNQKSGSVITDVAFTKLGLV